MPLQSSGQITMFEIAAEFGDTAPHAVSEFYRNGGKVESEKIVDASGSNITSLSGTYAPKFQSGSIPNNLQVFQGNSNSPSSSGGSADANRYLANGSLFSENEDGTCYPRQSVENSGTWTAPYAGTVNIICVGAGAAASWWGGEGGDSGAGGGAVYATATVSNGATLNWVAGGGGFTGTGTGPNPGNQNRGGGGGGGTSQVTGTNSSGTSFTVRALGGQWSSFSGYFTGFGTSGQFHNGQERHEGGPAYATGGCTQVSAATGGHGFWWGNGGTNAGPSGWGDSGLNSIITSSTTWTGHTNIGYSWGNYTDLSFNSSSGAFNTGSGGWGQGGRKDVRQDGNASVGGPGIVFIWMDPKQLQSINQNVPTSGGVAFSNYYGTEDT